MSVLYLGIVHKICFPFILASSLFFLNDFTMTDGTMFNPRMPFTRVGSNNIFLESSIGVELRDPSIRIEDSLNPAFCSVCAITASVSSAAFLSVAVISTNKFLLFDVTSVSFEFIIGGNEMVFPVESNMTGTLVFPSRRDLYA